MKLKLNNDDRCAIDLVLQQRSADEEVSANCFAKSNASLQKRVKRVEKLFDLLAQMPQQEPPANLLAATLKHVRLHEHDVIAGQPVTKGVTVSHAMSHRTLQ